MTGAMEPGVSSPGEVLFYTPDIPDFGDLIDITVKYNQKTLQMILHNPSSMTDRFDIKRMCNNITYLFYSNHEKRPERQK